MFPGVFLSTEGARWESIDADSARLFVPFGDSTGQFKVFFNPVPGLIEKMETMRWKNAGDQEKTRWQAQVIAWDQVKGWQMPVEFAAQWINQDSPWLIAKIEDVAWNVDVSEYIQREGLKLILQNSSWIIFNNLMLVPGSMIDYFLKPRKVLTLKLLSVP